MNPAVERFLRTKLVRRSARLITLLAIVALILQGFAEQGGIGSSLDPVPQQPLPFPRERIFGVDLSDRPSLEIVEWLEASGSSMYALAIVRVDADIIAALRIEDQASDAYRALDQLMAATRDTNVALCLDRPVTEIDDDLLAELTIDALRDRYPDRIAYITSCAVDQKDTWASSLAAQVRSTAPASDGRLLPLSTGAVVERREVESFEDIRTSRLRTFAGSVYVLPTVPIVAPLTASELQISTDALRDAAQVGLVLLHPARSADPAAVGRSLSSSLLPTDQLPEGFTGVTAPGLVFEDGWEISTVGRVVYQRTDTSGATLRSTFVGTTIYLQALLSPDAGSIALWIDPDLNNPGSADRTIDLSTSQARDAAIVLAEGLAAEQHTIVLVTAGGDVTVSGFFVSGQPASGWNAGLSALALIVATAAGFAVLGLAQVLDIRDRHALPPSRTPGATHPRAYTRDE